jgi:phosphoglycerate dehydrogenase-like enzyme
MPLKVVFMGHKDFRGLHRLPELVPPEVSLTFVEGGLPIPEKVRLCRQADPEAMVLGILPQATAEVFQACPRLRFIQIMSAGFDYLDAKSLMERGILIANNSPSIAPSVAEHTFTLMLAVYRHLTDANASVRQGVWKKAMGDDFLAPEIGGKTVGIVGLGNIGQRVARRLRGWDARAIYHDIKTFPAELEKELNVRRVGLEELLRTSDIVTMHVPLTKLTRGMISHRELGMMKPSAILINTSRGPVVDERALYQALKEKRIAAAGLDVLEKEPTPADNPLLTLDNVVFTPHTAGSSVETMQRILAFCVENLKRLAAGQKPLSLIEVQD